MAQIFNLQKMTVIQFIEAKVKPFAEGNFPVDFKVLVGEEVVYQTYFYGGIEVSRNVFKQMTKDEKSIINIVFNKNSIADSKGQLTKPNKFYDLNMN